MQDLTCGLVKLHEVYPPFKPVQLPMDVIPSVQHINNTTQFVVISKLDEGALDPAVGVDNKGVKKQHSKYQP